MKKLNHVFVLLISFFVMGMMPQAEAATIKGKVTFEGTAPAPQPIKMEADPICKALHPDGVTTEDVVVNSNGTLKNVFVYVKDGLNGQKFPAPKEPVVFDQKGCRYYPHVLGVQVGQPLQIVNSDNTLHNVHAMPTKSPQFNLGMPLQGMKLSKTFANPEVMVKVKCDVHGWMNAYIGVLDHPFFNASGEEGTFELKNVPPGTYVIEAWHEKFGAQTQNVTIGSADEVKELDFAYKG